MSQLKRTLAVSVIALFFTFGALAVSLAYEATPAGPLYTGKLQYLVTTGTGPLFTGIVPTGLQFEAAYLPPDPPRPCWAAYQISNIGFVQSLIPFHAVRRDPAKVSLRILNSALLL
jgi:hypothetical protein